MVYVCCSRVYDEVGSLFIAEEEKVHKKNLETYELLIRLTHTDHQSVWPYELAIRMVHTNQYLTNKSQKNYKIILTITK